jgi:hypothetical protein
LLKSDGRELQALFFYEFKLTFGSIHESIEVLGGNP